MTSRTAWTAGNGNSGAGLTWSAALNSSDLTSMPNADTVLSSVADIANGTALDMFMDLSIAMAIASSTIAAGANIAAWIFALNQDGSTYGDGQFASGSQAAKTPTFVPCAIFPLVAAAAQTTLLGFAQQIIIPPGSFRIAVQNNSGFALTAGTQTIKYRTYNINLNN